MEGRKVKEGRKEGEGRKGEVRKGAGKKEEGRREGRKEGHLMWGASPRCASGCCAQNWRRSAALNFHFEKSKKSSVITAQ